MGDKIEYTFIRNGFVPSYVCGRIGEPESSSAFDWRLIGTVNFLQTEIQAWSEGVVIPFEEFCYVEKRVQEITYSKFSLMDFRPFSL